MIKAGWISAVFLEHSMKILASLFLLITYAD